MPTMPRKIEELILASMTWKLSRQSHMCPLAEYLQEENNRREPGNFVKDLIAPAWGIGKTAVFNRNDKLATSIFSAEISDRFKQALRFKCNPQDLGSHNQIFKLLDGKKDRLFKGWLRKDLFSAPKGPWTYKDCCIVILFQGLCSGNPNGNYNALLSHAFGVSRKILSKKLAETLPSVLLLTAEHKTPSAPCQDNSILQASLAKKKVNKKRSTSYLPSTPAKGSTLKDLASPDHRPPWHKARLFSPSIKDKCDIAAAVAKINLNATVFSSGTSPTKAVSTSHDSSQCLSPLPSDVIEQDTKFIGTAPDSNTASTTGSNGLPPYTPTLDQQLAIPHIELPDQRFQQMNRFDTYENSHNFQQQLSRNDATHSVQPLPSSLPEFSTRLYPDKPFATEKSDQSFWRENTNSGLLELISHNKLGHPYVSRHGLPLPLKNKANTTINKKNLAQKGDTVAHLLQILGDDDNNTLLQYVATKKGMLNSDTKEDDENNSYTIIEAYTQMSIMGISIRKFAEMDRFNRLVKNIKIYPTNLTKELSSFEKMNSLPITNGAKKLLLKKGEGNKPDDYGLCDYFALMQPHRGISLLINACMLSGRYLSSEQFSLHDSSTLIFAFGADKGGTCTSMLVRCANRHNGNGSEYCCTIASVERAAECDANLRQTIYKSRSSHKEIIQDLVLDMLHAFVVMVKNDNGVVEASQSFVVRLVNGPEPSLGKVLPPLKTQLNQGPILQYDARLLPPHDEFQERPQFFDLDMPKNLTIELGYQFMKGANSEKYVGFCITTNEDKSFGFRFEEQIDNHKHLSFCCFQLLGFPSHDTKHGWIVAGISPTHSVSCNCLHCTADKAIYNSVPPKWIQDYDTTIPASRASRPDDPIRDGKYSGNNCWKNYCTRTGGGKYSISNSKMTEINRAARGITHEPLLYFPPSKDPLAPMHTPQGIFASLSNNIRHRLRRIDEQGDWKKELDSVHEDVICTLQNGTKHFKEQDKHFTKLSTKITRQETTIRRLKENKARPDALREAHQTLTALRQDRDLYCDQSGLTQRNRLSTCATTIKDAIEEALRNDSKIPRGQAEYTFDKALPVFGKVSYLQQHGGSALSHRDGMKVLREFGKVKEVVSSVYSDVPSLQDQAIEVMSDAEKIATPLYELCMVLKSQKKFDNERLKRLRDLVAEVYLAFRTVYPEQDVFPKLHHLLHIPDFVSIHGMFGILSEEGFEAIHPRLNRIVKDLKPMMNTDIRLQTTSNRLSKSLNSDVEALRQQYTKRKNSRYTTSRPKTYETKQNTRNDENLPVPRLQLEVVPGGDYLWTSDQKGVLKASWKQVYELLCHSIVPEKWFKIFDDRQDLGTKKKGDARFYTK